MGGKKLFFGASRLQTVPQRASIKLKRIMEVNIQVFLPGSGILHWSNYRVCTGMMIGPATLLARGKLQYVLILRHHMPFGALHSTEAAKNLGTGWEEL